MTLESAKLGAMTIHLYANIPHATRQIDIDLWDCDETGSAVWRVSCGPDQRFVEGTSADEVWDITTRAARAYEE